MPQYLTRKGNTFYFRQGVPEELRAILGRREIKKSLGRDYAKAVQGCKRYAVDADNLIAEARAKLDSVTLAHGSMLTKIITSRSLPASLSGLQDLLLVAAPHRLF